MVLAVLLCGLGVAQEAPGNAPAQVRRRALLELQYQPDGDTLRLEARNRDGSQDFPLEALKLHAIGDQAERGRRVDISVERVNDSGFRAQPGLPEGAWNLVLEATAGGERLVGYYWLGVDKSPVQARVALVRAPDAEVSRLSWWAIAVFAVPVGLGALAVAWGLVGRARAAQTEP